jgi:hypothetical protein
VQYPGYGVPLHFEVCIQVPEPEGVEHLLLVQHLISLLPAHRFEVTVPVQQPAEIDTHIPSIPEAVQVALYEHPVEVDELNGCSSAASNPSAAQALENKKRKRVDFNVIICVL